MKAVTTAAVVTATVASNVSFAQQIDPAEMPTAMSSSLKYAQSANAPIAPPVYQRLDEEVNQMIHRPKTPVEFVKNLKFIFDHDLLLNDDFYTEASLRDAFNLEDTGITRTDEKNEDRRVSVISSHFLSIFPWVKIPGTNNLVASAQLIAGKTIYKSGLTTAGINFGLREGGPDFDEITRIFRATFVYVQAMPSPHSRVIPATAPHGNEQWKYQQADDKTKKTITIHFNPAGELSNILVEFEEK